MSGGPFRPRGERGAPAADEPGSEARPGAGPAAGARAGGAAPAGRPRRPARRLPGGQGSWIAGVVAVVVLGYITVNTLTTDTRGSRGPQPGSTLPPFAAPLATGDVEGDANVLVKARDGVPRACAVRGPGIFNVCQAGERGPLVLGFLAAPSERCADEVDVLDRLARRFPDVGFAVVAVRGDRADLRRLVRDRGWRIPVAWDRDGAVSNTYGIAVCPTVTFARRGGVVDDTTLGAADADELTRRVEAIR